MRSLLNPLLLFLTLLSAGMATADSQSPAPGSSFEEKLDVSPLGTLELQSPYDRVYSLGFSKHLMSGIDLNYHLPGTWRFLYAGLTFGSDQTVLGLRPFSGVALGASLPLTDSRSLDLEMSNIELPGGINTTTLTGKVQIRLP